MNLWTAIQSRAKHLSLAVLVTIGFGVGFLAGNFTSATSAQQNVTIEPEVEEAFEPFWQALNLIRSEYIEEVPLEDLVDGATEGLFAALGDEFSGYMTPELFDMMNADLAGEIEGIGVVIRTDEETSQTEVVGLIEGAPAEAAGVLPGDIFYSIDGMLAEGMTQLELASHVRGPEGTSVTIEMDRDGELIEFVITRTRIIIPNVETDILEDNVAYLRLNQFSATSRADLNNALSELEVNERSGLILDLRDNPGGLLSSAVDVASAFISEGVVITEVFGDGREQVYNANGTSAGIEVPIVVLINEGSASASEILAGSMQDLGTATLIGQTTFGKGTVQTWHALSNGGGARITIARWLTAGGRSIHDVGVTPDIVIEWTPQVYQDPNDPQIDAALAFLRGDEAGIAAAQEAAEAMLQ